MGPKLIFDIMSYRPRRERKRTDMLQRGKYLGYELEIRHNVNGPKKYCVPGREPDTADSLENDGLIKQKGKDIVVLKPDDLRVIAWQLGANEYCRANRMPLPFPDLGDVKVTEGH
jgi:hypothetical protein